MNPQLHAQLNVRQQAEELQDYMKDLFGWQKDLKQKEKAIKRTADANLPPVRGRAQPSSPGHVPVKPGPAARPAPAAPPAPAPRHPAAHTYEHYIDKWEKFDVDAALASDDEAEAAPSSRGGGRSSMAQTASQVPASSSKPSAGAPLPAARIRAAAQAAASRAPQPTTAEGWKDEGNSQFKAGAFQQAVESYSASLALTPTCLAFANRAMARLKLQQYAEAESDCTEALALDPAYVKAYQRRATARRELGDLLGAVDDYEAALRWEPTNKATAAEYRQCISHLLEGQGLVWDESKERVHVTLAAAAQPAAPSSAAPSSAAQSRQGIRPVVPAAAAVEPAVAAVAPAARDGEVHIQAVSSKRKGGLQERGATKALLISPLAAAGAAVAQQRCGGSAGGVESGGEASEEGEEALPPLPQQGLVAEQALLQAGTMVAQQQQQQPQQDTAGATTAVPCGPAHAAAAAAPAGVAVPTEALRSQASTQPSLGAAQLLPPTIPAPLAPAASSSKIQEAPSTTAVAPATAAGAGPQGAVLTNVAAPLQEAAAGISPEVSGAGVAAAVAGALRHVAPALTMKAPRTGLDFEKGWKSCKGDPSLQSAYLQLIPPAKLSAVLKQTLTPSLLAALLRTLLGPTAQRAPAHAVAMLEALPAVARFDMNMLSLPTREKAGLREAWDQAQVQLQGAGEAAELTGRLVAVRQQYKL